MYEKVAHSLGLFFDNHLNPILVRELRRMVRSRFIVIMLNLYILLLVFVCLMMITLNVSTLDAGFGEGLFYTLAAIMGFASFLVVVVYTGIVGASERINADLMYSSTIKPSQIILGKFISGLVLSFMLFSAVFPFFTLAYLLRGLDFYTFLITIYLIFLAIHTVNSVVILISCNIRTPLQMIFICFFGVFFVLPGLFNLIFSSRFGPYSLGPVSFTNNWEFLLSVSFVSLSVISFFLIAGIVSVSPASSNRAVPMRFFLSGWFLLSFVAYALVSTYFHSVGNIFNAWVALHLVLLGGMLPFLCSERDFWNQRIRSTIPSSPPLRLFVFPFYTGASCALAWWACYAGVLFLTTVAFSATFYPAPPEFGTGVLIILFAVDYFVTALLLRTWVFHRKITPGKTWIIATFMLVFFTVGSMLSYFLINYKERSYDPLDGYENHIVSVLNPFMLFNSPSTHFEMSLQANGAIIWGVLLLPFFVTWLLVRLYRFSPQLPEEILTYEKALFLLGLHEEVEEPSPSSAETVT